MAFEARRGLLAWTRMLLPAVILMEGLGLLGLEGSRAAGALRLALAGLLELALLGFAAWRFLRLPPEPGVLPEDHLAKPLEAFFPPRAARLMALELVILGSALRFLAGGWRRPDPPGFSMSKEATLGVLLPVLPLLLVADLLLLELLLRHLRPWLRLLVHALDLYGLLWITGLWAALRRRPHTLDDQGRLRLHHAFLGHLELHQDQIEAVEELPEFPDDWARLRFMKGVAQLQTPGPAQLLLKLREPLRPMGLLGPGKAKDRVLISVDEPEALIEALGLGERRGH